MTLRFVLNEQSSVSKKIEGKQIEGYSGWGWGGGIPRCAVDVEDAENVMEGATWGNSGRGSAEESQNNSRFARYNSRNWDGRITW